MAKEYFYDLHIHSCLSPCGDNTATPHDIAGMAVVNGLDIIALTDHNSCKNCPAVLQAAEGSGITVIPGMEINTSEEIHVVCLLPDLAAAMAFDSYVHDRLVPIINQPDVFGDQLIMDEEDRVIGTEPLLLVNATTISIDTLPKLLEEYGGFCFPSHIDKDYNSILAALGEIPPHIGFTAAEVFMPDRFFARPDGADIVAGLHILTNSDAHYPWGIAAAERRLPLEEPTFAALKKYLSGPV